MLINAVCIRCRVAFSRHVSKSNADTVRFCSRRCASDAKSAVLTCDGCGLQFRRAKSQIEGIKNYCSGECAGRPRRDRGSVGEPQSIDGARWIDLGGGHFCLVDESDYGSLSRYTWRPLVGAYTVYAARSTRSRKDGTAATILMHRWIVAADDGVHVDHVNMNGLDNRRQNLRPATPGENAANTLSRNGSASRFKGVAKAGPSWEASIRADGVRTRLGHFKTEEEAAAAYDRALRARFGSRGRYNFPMEGERSALSR